MPELVLTGDGSHSLRMDNQSETYHSRHGAITESMHVFIRNGFSYATDKETLRILEVGFGTGLNCLLTVIAAEESGTAVHYTALEPYPPSKDLLGKLNYAEILGGNSKEFFTQIHDAGFSEEYELTKLFTLKKIRSGLSELQAGDRYDLVYFDAFAPAVNPELWTADMFRLLHSRMSSVSILVTYCAKGEVKRAMKAAGFSIEALPGPPGKREMTRAFKS